MRSLLLTAVASASLLTACGGSDSSSGSSSGDDQNRNDSVQVLYGTWQEPLCKYNQYYADTGTNDYKRQYFVFDADSVEVQDNVYADSDCTTIISSSVDEYFYTDEGSAVDADTGLTVRKVALADDVKYTAYVNPRLNQIVLTGGDDTYPEEMDFDQYYVKQGADFQYKAGEQHIAVLGHFGLNFETGLPAHDGDAYTGAWSYTGAYIDGEGYGSGVWIGAKMEDGLIYIYDTGLTDMDAVTSGPAAWPAETAAMAASQKGRVYVVKGADDQLTKLKLLNTPNPDGMWNVLVEYERL